MRIALTVIVLALCATCTSRARFTPVDRAGIESVLRRQAEAWNRGDLAAYMAAYTRDAKLVFTSGGKIRRGWQATFDAFHARYARDPKAMGTLAFEILSIDPLGADGAVALGQWRLTGSPSDGGGVFSVVFERRPGEGWTIVHDHTSSDPALPPRSGTQGPPSEPGPPDAAAWQPADPPWEVPSGWRTEVIPFPLDFAKDIAHEGFEDIRFPPKFFEPGSGDYWSYAFRWRTRDAAMLDAAALSDELTRYFRGLVAAVDEKREIAERDAIRASATAAADGTFPLTAHVVDAFTTKQPLDLVGWAQRTSCKEGALWVFVLAPPTTKIRGELDALARRATCAR